MRTTLAIADDILRELRKVARSKKVSLTRAANEVLRAGLAAGSESPKRKPYVEAPLDLGEPQIDLTKALTLAAEIEDEEAVRKLQLRK